MLFKAETCYMKAFTNEIFIKEFNTTLRYFIKNFTLKWD